MTVEFTPNDEFLQIAARQGPPPAGSRRSCAHPSQPKFALPPFSPHPWRISPKTPPPRKARRSDWLRARMRLSDSDSAETAAWPWRSSGTKPAPINLRALMPRVPTRPIRDQNDIVGGNRIFSGQRIEQFALPIARNAGDCQHFAGMHFQTDILQGHSERRSGRRSQMSGLKFHPRLLPLVPSALTCAISLPTIMRASEAGVSRRGSHAPVTLPWRRTVARSQMRCTSSSRWLMYRTEPPPRLSACSAFQTAGRPPAASAPRSAHRE